MLGTYLCLNRISLQDHDFRHLSSFLTTSNFFILLELSEISGRNHDLHINWARKCQSAYENSFETRAEGAFKLHIRIAFKIAQLDSRQFQNTMRANA